MANQYIKITLTLLSILFLLQTGYGASCFFSDNPQQSITREVYNENNVYQGTLNALNNNIRNDWSVKISFQGTTDDNTIDSQEFAIAKDEKKSDNWQFNQVLYNDLDLVLATYSPYTNQNLEFGGKTYNFYSLSKSFNNYDSQSNYFKFAINNISTGEYKFIYKSTDSCGDFSILNDTVNVYEKPTPNQKTCTGVTTINQSEMSVYVEDTCSEIKAYQNSDNLTIYYNGSSYNKNNKMNVLLNATDNSLKNLFVQSNVINFNWTCLGFCNAASWGDISIYSNYNQFDTTISNNFATSTNFKYNNYNGKLEVFNTVTDTNLFGLTNITYNYYENTRTRITPNIRYSNLNYNYLSSPTCSDPFLPKTVTFEKTFSNDIHDNTFKFSSECPTFEIGSNIYSLGGIYKNNFYNLSTYVVNTQDTVNYYANKFYLINRNISIYQDTGNNMIFGKNISGKMLGNAYLNENGDDIFTCPTSTHNITFQDTIYSVCKDKVLIANNGGTNLYDYIIVTDEQAGGYEPKQKLKTPVADLQLSDYSPTINEDVTFDISGSYDIDGSIVSTQVQVDNIFYNDKSTGTFTSKVPDAVSIKAKVTDNDGLTDTTYQTVNFAKPDSECLGNTPPYADIKTTKQDTNTYTFEVVNESDVDNDEIISKIWRINYEDIEADKVTETVRFNQTVHLTVFDGCSENTFTKYMESTYADSPEEWNEPIVELDCDLNQPTPTASLDCSVTYDTRGNELENIKWYYDGVNIQSSTNTTQFTTTITDTNLHNVMVSVKTNASQKSEKFTFQLYENTFTFEELQTTTEENESYEDYGIELFTGDVGQDTQNVQQLFTLLNTPIGYLLIIGFILLFLSMLFLLLTVIGFLVKPRK